MPDLKLIALDEQDLEVISAFTQDAVIRVGDMGVANSGTHFACLINRYVWEDNEPGRKGERRRTALDFSRVTDVTSTGISLEAKDGILDLLAIRFAPDEEPSGRIILEFAGGGTVELKVECIEARLNDMGAAWTAKARPAHELE